MDQLLNSLYDTKPKWDNLGKKLLDDYLPEDVASYDGPSLVRRGYPRATDPADNDENEFTLERIDPGSSAGALDADEFLVYATYVHNENTHKDIGSRAVLEHFDPKYQRRTFYSMCRPIERNLSTENARLVREMWREGEVFCLLHNIPTSKIVLAQPRELYKWGTNETRLDSGEPSVTWRTKFCPLIANNWNVPNSKLNTLSFPIDPNTVYTYNWYLSFIQSTIDFDDTLKKYATELIRKKSIEEKLDVETKRFVEMVQSLRSDIRDGLYGTMNLNRRNKAAAAQYRRYVQLVDQLFRDFYSKIGTF